MIRGLAGLGAGILLVLAFPVLLYQARQLKTSIPRLPEAGGPRSGRIDGREPVLRLHILGESPAAGVGVERMEDSLGPRMARELAARNGRAVQWQVIAANGRTAAALAVHDVAGMEDAPADLVVIALGVNDSLHFHSARRWIRSLEVLIGMVRRRCGREVPILVTPVPDLERFPALPAPLRTVLGLKARALDQALTRRLSDMPHVFRPSVELGGDSPEFFARDGFHPGPAGHREWGRRLAVAAVDWLGEESAPVEASGKADRV